MINSILLGHKNETTDGRRIWYIAELSGFVVEIDMRTDSLRCIWRIPDFPYACSYRLIFYCENKLYLFPFTQSAIYVYDLETENYETITIKSNFEFMSCVHRDRYIYAFGAKSTFIKYNIDDNSVKYIDINLMESKIENIPPKWFWKEIFVEDECIYVPIQVSNLLVAIDHNDRVSCICLGDLYEKWIIKSIKIKNEKFYAIYGKGKINNIDLYISVFDLDGKMISNSCVDDNLAYSLYQFIDAILINGKWLVLPFGRNQILFLDPMKSQILYEIENGTDFISEKMPGLFWCSVWIDEYTLCSVNQAVGEILIIHVDDFRLEYRTLKYEELPGKYAKSMKENMKANGFLNEMGVWFDLQHYMNFICCE